MTEEKEVVSSNGQEETEKEDDAEIESEFDTAIIRQVEYYFGDVNLPRDKFLREQVKLDDGWVPLDVLIKFNRLAKLSTDLEKIADSLNKSSSGLLEVSEDKTKVRRSPEMPLPEMNEDRRKEVTGRTIYAKGFPKDSSLDDLLTFFKQFEEVENIIMRKYLDKKVKVRVFKGSIFATFKTKEQADKFMEVKDVRYNDTDLLILWQDKYIQQKQEEYATKKEKKDRKQKNKELKEDRDEFKLPAGTILHFTQCDDKTSRENVKDALTPLGEEVAYIDFKVGNTEGWVRLAKENTAKNVAEKMNDGKLKICDTDVVFRVVEGDEEKQYLVKTVEEMSKRRKNMKNFKQNRNRNYKGKQGGRKRRHDYKDDGPPAKIKTNAS